MSERLPIEELRGEFIEALGRGPLVVSSPTGSGKSTQVPRWCPGRVLVVEPRRVACRGLAQRVAELEGSPLGEAVGYHVRDERRAGDATRVLFVTPGVALRIFDSLCGYDTVLLDEFHERGLEVDLLLALLLRSLRQKEFGGRLVVMSATLEGARVADHLGGRHLHAEGRLYPIAVHHLAEGGGREALLPSVRGLENRVRRAVDACHEGDGGILVFLPGKAEIASCHQALAKEPGLDVLELHGGLTLAEQSRAFEPTEHRKVVLATNVAETSITLPDVATVIDSGLVRQTRYHRGRGFLTLVPVALDSADQRAGRAGRTGPGVCYRLWSEAAQLEPRTLPEIHRESLVPLVLSAAACGARVEELPFLDPPKEHAVEAARDQLATLGGLDGGGRITDVGRQLFGLPLDAPLSRLLVEARDSAAGGLEDAVDLVSVLAVGRPLWTREKGPAEDDDGDDAFTAACDATAMIRALRSGGTSGTRRCRPWTLQEARTIRKRLRQIFELPGGASASDGPGAGAAIDRKRLALTVLAADPTSAHVARRRGRRVAWSNGGTEIELGRDSAVRRLDDGVEAIAVLETRALAAGRDTRVIATCAMPLPIDWLVEAGLGRDRLGGLAVEGHRVTARIERVYARRVLAVRQEDPEGALARQALARLFLAGEIFPDSLALSRERLAAAALAADLAARGLASWNDELPDFGDGKVPDLDTWVAARLDQLGVESGGDLALLSADDLLAPEVPPTVRRELDREFPRNLRLPGALYEIEVDVGRRRVTLRQVTGRKIEVPPPAYVPRFSGFAVRLEHKGTIRKLRG